MIVAFTGHRPDKLGSYEPNEISNKVKGDITKALSELKPEKVISGMALGVDQIAAEVCIDLGIPFIAAVPFLGQESMWPLKSKEHYRYLLSKASDIEVVCDGGYAAWKLQKRNEWMVDNCNLLIAVWNGSDGGTKNCFDYAQKVGRKTFIIDVF